MKIIGFLKSANHEPYEILLRNFINSIDGHECSVSSNNTYEDCDLSIIWGSWKIERSATHHVVKKDIVQKSKKFIVLETPLLGRLAVNGGVRDTWYRVGVNGFLYNTGKFNYGNHGPDRWEKIKNHFNLELKPWSNNKNGDIVIALQLPGDASLQGIDVSKWVYDTCIDIRKYTDRNIIVRTPQLERSYTEQYIVGLSKIKNLMFQKGTKENLQPTINNAYCVVTYSSGMGIETVLSGTPSIAYSPASFVYDLCDNDVSKINNIKTLDREQWLYNLSYSQWNHEEVANGDCWNHIKGLI